VLAKIFEKKEKKKEKKKRERSGNTRLASSLTMVGREGKSARKVHPGVKGGESVKKKPKATATIGVRIFLLLLEGGEKEKDTGGDGGNAKCGKKRDDVGIVVMAVCRERGKWLY